MITRLLLATTTVLAAEHKCGFWARLAEQPTW
ncbi:hypothetical protein BC739_001307 [Kutzneria viridogrisea]|uniref:Uncharacterized protein n=1 Tax=Kutzneria viridogrisea TaxID=47990 RepID=A0ABR6BB70_9PSEU|nr:hypothetical protein [Kutzneria viridogrisea]